MMQEEIFYPGHFQMNRRLIITEGLQTSTSDPREEHEKKNSKSDNAQPPLSHLQVTYTTNPQNGKTEGSTYICYSHHRISLSFSFCAEVKLDGNFTLISTIISPLSVGFLLFGIPKSGKLIL